MRLFLYAYRSNNYDIWGIVESINIMTGSEIFTEKHPRRRFRDERIIFDCVRLYGALIDVGRLVLQ
jgi:hypothetical protein